MSTRRELQLGREQNFRAELNFPHIRRELYTAVLGVALAAGCGGLALGVVILKEVTGWSVGLYVEAGQLGARVELETPCYKSWFDPDMRSPLGIKTTYVDGSFLLGYDGKYRWIDWGSGTVGCYLLEN